MPATTEKQGHRAAALAAAGQGTNILLLQGPGGRYGAGGAASQHQ